MIDIPGYDNSRTEQAASSNMCRCQLVLILQHGYMLGLAGFTAIRHVGLAQRAQKRKVQLGPKKHKAASEVHTKAAIYS